jgi:hypothetical protein
MSVTLKPVAPMGRTLGPRRRRPKSAERDALAEEDIAARFPGFG